MSSAIEANGNDSVSTQVTTSGFQSFENAAADAVLAISYNPSGTRYAVASADHKVRIYDSGNQYSNGQSTLMDQWRAHDAEILDVSALMYHLRSNCESKKKIVQYFHCMT